MRDSSDRPAVFLSFSSRDVSAGYEVRRMLNEAGFEVLAATEVVSRRGNVMNAIRDAMLQSDAYVVVASSAMSDSPWTAFELGAAMAWSKPVYVVATDDGALPTYLDRLQVFKLSELARLERALRRNAEPLSELERQVLSEIYVSLGVPTDQVFLDPDAAAELTEEFNRRTRARASPDRLLRELMRLRKMGRLPKLRKARPIKTRRTA